MKYNQIFLGQDGNKILSGGPDNFSKYFDWTIVPFNQNILFTIKRKNIPQTIYLKTDFIPRFVKEILPLINNEFILITACSDFSPEVDFKHYNFKKNYDILIEDPRLKFWFMNNMKTKREKSFSLPVGFGAGIPGFGPIGNTPEQYVDNFVLEIRKSSKIENKKTDKIFCSFRDPGRNVCGEEMYIRGKILKIIEKQNDIFDIFPADSMNFEFFVKKLAEYKYSLCPHGNGMDPSPTAWLSLAVNTIPVIYETPNVVNMFEGTDSVIFFDKFEQIIDKNLYVDKNPIKFEFLTCEYWANKIKSKI